MAIGRATEAGSRPKRSSSGTEPGQVELQAERVTAACLPPPPASPSSPPSSSTLSMAPPGSWIGAASGGVCAVGTVRALVHGGEQDAVGGHLAHDEPHALPGGHLLGELRVEQIARDRERAAVALVGVDHARHHRPPGREREPGQQDVADEREVEREDRHRGG